MPSTPTSASLAAYFRDSAALAAAGVHAPDAAVEDLWLDRPEGRIHCDLHRAADAVATVVFLPGVGSYGRFYAPLGQALARAGFHMVAVDRPGHGWSDGPRGDCTVPEALRVTELVMEDARRRFGLPVVLFGSSLGGVLTGFAVVAGLRPDLAIVHNFVMPGRLFSLRIRAAVVGRWRRKPYPLAELAHGFKGITRDPALLAYLRAADDPQAAWQQSVAFVASLFAHNPPRPTVPHAPTIVFTGAQDRIIPAWATRFFVRWAGLRPLAVHTLPDCGHMLFHHSLPKALPVLLQALREGLGLREREGSDHQGNSSVSLSTSPLRQGS